MRTIRYLLLILLSLTVTCSWADIIPIPGGPRPSGPRNPNWPPKPGENLLGNPMDWKGPGAPTSGNPPVTASEPGVALEAASVQIRIKKMKAATETGEKIPRLAAYVKGEFDLAGSAVPPEGKDLGVFFPLAYEDEGPPVTLRFAVAIDGKPAAEVKKADVSVTDENNRPRTLVGYAWRLTGLHGGEKRRIAVQYAIVLPQKEGKTQFIYFLRSGARWDGPIGKEVVNITADRGLRLEVLSPAALQPLRRSNTSLTWRITNAKPDEDIKLSIVTDTKP
jgi:hypothetical protein